MATFHLIHILVGAWLAVVNFFRLVSPDFLVINNVVLGVVVALYNAYFLARGNVDVTDKNRRQ